MNFLRPSLAKFFGIASSALLVVGLLFRFAVYRHMYKAPGDPYGISDLIEFGLGIALLASLAASMLVVIALAVRGPRENRVAAAWLFGTCALIGLLVDPLHYLAAKWAP